MVSRNDFCPWWLRSPVQRVRARPNPQEAHLCQKLTRCNQFRRPRLYQRKRAIRPDQQVIVQAELIPIVLFLSVVAAIKIVMDGHVRRKLAESDASETLVRSMLLTDEQNRRLSTLKWGLVLALVGMAFGLIDLLNLSAKDPATFGMLIATAGPGMLRFHALASRRS